MYKIILYNTQHKINDKQNNLCFPALVNDSSLNIVTGVFILRFCTNDHKIKMFQMAKKLEAAL